MGRILGQRVYFELFAPTLSRDVVDRYRSLSEEAFATLDRHLSSRAFLAGDNYSIADIVTLGWTHIAVICGFGFERHRHLTRWHDAVARRPAVRRGVMLPAPATGPCPLFNIKNRLQGDQV